jgi:site-specific DNA-methyltransferase (adenine-specific)
MGMTTQGQNLLYYGDNLDVLRRYLKDETVDLIYLDPPFNSNATYNVLFAEKNGSQAAGGIMDLPLKQKGKHHSGQ